MKKPWRIMQSPLTDRFYAFNAYKIEGTTLIVTGQKHDVTDDIKAILKAAAIRTLPTTT